MSEVWAVAKAAYGSCVKLAPKMLPAAPLREQLRASGFDFDTRLELSLRSGVPERTIYRILAGQYFWVRDYIADRLCLAVGTHPFFVWGDAWTGKVA
jgi:hypothetical protein